MLGATLGLHYPQAARAGPCGIYLPAFTQADLLSMLNLPTAIACSIAAHHGSVHPVQFACVLKGGLLSIATQELLLAFQPSPPGLDPRHHDLSYQRWLRLARGPGPEDVEQKGEQRREGRDTRGPRRATSRLPMHGPGDTLESSPDPRDKSSPGSASCRGTIPAPNAIPC